MEKTELDRLITFAESMSTHIEEIRNSVYSSEEIDDVDAVLERLMAMEKLAEGINSAIRFLDEENQTVESMLEDTLNGRD